MKLQVALGERSYDIIIERGSSASAGEYLNLRRRALVVTDSGVPPEYAARVADACDHATVVTAPAGEGSKSIAQFERLLSAMLENGFTRRDCVVAVGGGVVGDLAGFAASAYMRGVDFYNIPTTALAQIDSSIGGKTAVNLGGIKNVVGAFYQPRRVLIDAVKMAATFDEELFSMFERGDAFDNIEEIIARSVDIKRRVVEADEREGGLRRVLNFGHTIGHGIEAEEELHGLYHGECVALGMLPMCSPEARERLLCVLTSLGVPTRFTFDPERVMAAAMHDKKSDGDGVSVVFVEKIGSYEIRRMRYDELDAHLRRYIRETSK